MQYFGSINNMHLITCVFPRRNSLWSCLVSCMALHSKKLFLTFEFVSTLSVRVINYHERKILKNQHQRNLQSALWPRLQKDFPFSSYRGSLARQAGKGGREGSLGVLKWREKIIPYREVTHSYLLGCALTFASKAKFEIEAKISFRFEAKKKPDFT
jgi:hypothetical protein